MLVSFYKTFLKIVRPNNFGVGCFPATSPTSEYKTMGSLTSDPPKPLQPSLLALPFFKAGPAVSSTSRCDGSTLQSVEVISFPVRSTPH